ncbi:MAG: hypothetical protein AAGF24_04320 [Cyanobacteria bacterium P01_H01_bin.121]
MKWIQKILAGFLLIIGVPMSLLAIIHIMRPATTEAEIENRDGAIATLALLGLPCSGAGGWLIWNLQQRHQKALKAKAMQQSNEQEQIFLQMLQEQQGAITILEFATQAQVSLETAKTYLDQQAIRLNGNFDATDSGGIVYRFPV